MHVFEVFAIGFAVVAAATEPVPLEGQATVWGNTSLRFYCLAGAILGAFAKEMAFTEHDTRRQQAAKLLSATIIATVSAPFILQLFGLRYSHDSVVGLSGIVSFSCLAVIKVGGPVVLEGIPKMIHAWLKKFSP